MYIYIHMYIHIYIISILVGPSFLNMGLTTLSPLIPRSVGGSLYWT